MMLHVSRHLKSLAIWIFVQQFVKADNKETSKVHITSPLWEESTGESLILITKDQ